MDERDRDIFVESTLREDSVRGRASLWIRILRRISLWAPFGARVIWSRDGRSPYLLRVTLIPRVWRLPAVFLHMFFRGDDDAEHHNHPWFWAVSFVLAHGYIEERLTDEGATKRFRRPWTTHVIRRDDFHRVIAFHPRRPWTLFIAGRRVDALEEEAWGFKHPVTGRYEHWRAHVDGVRAGSEAAVLARHKEIVSDG